MKKKLYVQELESRVEELHLALQQVAETLEEVVDRVCGEEEKCSGDWVLIEAEEFNEFVKLKEFVAKKLAKCEIAGSIEEKIGD